MGKIDRASISCPALLHAYDMAYRRAFDNIAGIPPNTKWDIETHGNQVSSKGTLVGIADCAGCGKHITVTINLPKIEASNIETREPVKLYDSLSGTESIKVSGHACVQEEHQK